MEKIEGFSKVVDFIESSQSKKYYVYRLVDPRTLQTFYVGKGCGDRVLQHARNVFKGDKDLDEYDLKSLLIAEILSLNKEVIPIIHRWGLSESTAFEVEAALIDAYPGLTNRQKGHGFERGAIILDDLIASVNMTPYDEPDEKYIIIKTSDNAVYNNGSLYDATRICWRASLDKAQHYKYVFSVINGIVREVYLVDRWFKYNSERIAFEGRPIDSSDKMSFYKNKLIPQKYRMKGASNPFLYSKK